MLTLLLCALLACKPQKAGPWADSAVSTDSAGSIDTPGPGDSAAPGDSASSTDSTAPGDSAGPTDSGLPCEGHEASLVGFRSSDQGASWTEESILLSCLSSLQPVDPGPLVDDEGQLWMYWFANNQLDGDPALSQPDGLWRMGLGRGSADGATFTEEAEVLSRDRSWTDPAPLLSPDGGLRLYLSAGTQVESAAGPSLAELEVEEGLRSPGLGGVPGATRGPDSQAWLYVCRDNRIRLLESDDGLSFLDAGAVLSAPAGYALACDPSPQRLADGGWVMALKLLPEGGSSPWDDEVWLARSEDGRAWSIDPESIGQASVPGLALLTEGDWMIYANRPPEP